MSGLLATQRMPLRHGLSLLGIVVVGRAIVLSIGGDVETDRFSVGIPPMALGISARLAPKANSTKRSSVRKSV